MNKELLDTFIGKNAKVDRGGPESREGTLLKAEKDHFVLLTEEDGIIYYQNHHVKSLTKNSKEDAANAIEVPEDFEYFSSEDFKGLLLSLRYHWVKINRGGPESLEGVLDDVNDDFITLVINEEVIRMALFHVRNISYGLKVEKEHKHEEKEEKVEESKSNKETKNSDE